MSKKILNTFICSSTIILIFLSVFKKEASDTDIFWALKSGEWIIQHASVPKTDQFSFTFQGKEWIDFTWGFQIIAYLAHTYLFGWHGLFILRAIIIGLAFFFLYKNLKLVSQGKIEIPLILIVITLFTVQDRFFTRPHIFGYLFITLYLYLLNLYKYSENKKYILYLILLQLLWVNIHSSFVLGIFLVSVYTVDEILQGIKKYGFRTKLPENALYLFICLASVVAVSFINPYGYKLALFPFIHQSADNTDAFRYIYEWHPISIKMILNLSPFTINFFFFKVLLIAAFISIIFNYRKVDIRDIVIIFVFIYIAFEYKRMIPEFAFAAAPIIASNISVYIKNRNATVSDKRFIAFMWIGIFMLLFTGFFNAFHSTDLKKYGIGIKTDYYPNATIKFIKTNNITGNIFNQYGFGGIIIYSLYPEVRVFIDGRTPTVYSPDFYWFYRMAEENYYVYKKVERDYNISVVIAKYNFPLCSALLKDKNYKLVAFDDVSALFLKDVPKNRDAISKQSYNHINPCGDTPNIKEGTDKNTLEAMRKELKTAIASAPDVIKNYRLLAIVNANLGGEYLKEAIVSMKKAIDITDKSYLWFEFGLIYIEAKEHENAISVFKKVSRKGCKDCYYYIGVSYFNMKDYKNTIKYLEKYRDIAGDESKKGAYEKLALAYANTGDAIKSASYFKKANLLENE